MKKIFLRINVSHKKTSFDNYAKTEEKGYGGRGGWVRPTNWNCVKMQIHTKDN